MTHPPAPVAKIAHEGERLRMALLDDLRRADGSPERAAVVTEMMMLFGQAFRHVYDACVDQPEQSVAVVKVIHECICGLAIYNLWLTSETPITPWQEYMRMTAHWEKVTEMVLGGDG